MSKNFTAEDLYLFEDIAELDCARDLPLAVVAVKTVDREQDDYRTVLWTVPLDGKGDPKQVTQGTSDRSPQWSPDGSRLLFIGSRDGAPQVYLMDRDGGEARALTQFEHGVVAATWSPDGRRIAVTVRHAVDPRERGARGAKPPPKNPIEVAWRLPYKMDGMGFTLNREIHLHVVDAASGESTQLTDGPVEVMGASWSPDGRRITCTKTREDRLAHRNDVWVIDADGGDARQLTHDLPSVQKPQFSPDGRRIAFVGSAREGDSVNTLWLVGLDGGKPREIADADAAEVSTADTVFWDDDGKTLYAGVAHRGLLKIARVEVESGRVEHVVSGERHVNKLARMRDRLVFVAMNIMKPNQVYSAKLDGSDERQHSDFNAWWKARKVPEVRLRRFDVPDGKGATEAIDAWVVEPTTGKEPHPLLIDSHGGPHSYVLLNCPGKIYWYLMANAGWYLVAPNAVGSSSYGREFAQRLRGAWGKLDLDQYLAVIDALQTEGLVGDRLVLTGKSYGGFLAAWAVSKTERFAAAIVSAPVANVESHFGTSDSGYYVTPYAMDGDDGTDRDRLRELSPLKDFPGSKTPTLFLQGKEDQRCPLGQSEELFTAMMRSSDTPAELVMYPGGDHHMAEEGRPTHREDYFTRLCDWAERHANARKESRPREAANDQRGGSGSHERPRAAGGTRNE